MVSDSVPVCSIFNSPLPDISTLLNPLTLLISVAAFPEPLVEFESILQPEANKAIAAGIIRLRLFMVNWILSLYVKEKPPACAGGFCVYSRFSLLADLDSAPAATATTATTCGAAGRDNLDPKSPSPL